MTGRPGSRRPTRGFTLLEVMVALAVLALSMMAISDVVGGALRNHVRARQLDVASTLARGKLAELVLKFEEDGFRDMAESEEGTFGDEGHPEVSWKYETVVPQVDLGADALVKSLTGMDGGLAGLMGMGAGGPAGATGAGSAGSGRGGSDPLSALPTGMGPVVALLEGQLTAFGEKIKKGVRELHLTVSWSEGKVAESFDVVTQLVVITPRSQKASQPSAAAAAAAAALGQGGVFPPGVQGPFRPKPPGRPGSRGSSGGSEDP